SRGCAPGTPGPRTRPRGCATTCPTCARSPPTCPARSSSSRRCCCSAAAATSTGRPWSRPGGATCSATSAASGGSPAATSRSTSRCSAPRTWRSSCEPAMGGRARGPGARTGGRGGAGGPARGPGRRAPGPGQRVLRDPGERRPDPQRRAPADRGDQVRAVGHVGPAGARGPHLAGAGDLLRDGRPPLPLPVLRSGRRLGRGGLMSAPMLDGRRALVVGARSGIGRAEAERFTAEGAAVVSVERDEAKCEDLRGAVPDVEVDQGVACEAAVNHEAVSRCRDLHGGLDVLVHCVGIFDFYRSFDAVAEDAFDDAFDEMFSVNVRSAMHGVRAALPELRRSRGNIVLTESTSAYRPGRGGAVTGVAPGGAVGTQLSGARSLGLGGRRLAGPGRAADIAARVPLQVALSGDDHAWSYLFLASPMSRGMTGAVLHSDGGAGV